MFGTKRLDLFCVFLQIKPSGPRQQSRKVSKNKRRGNNSKLLFKVKFNNSFYFFITGGQAVWTWYKSSSVWSETGCWAETSQKALHIQAVESHCRILQEYQVSTCFWTSFPSFINSSVQWDTLYMLLHIHTHTLRNSVGEAEIIDLF